jgi:hypothetical protein
MNIFNIYLILPAALGLGVYSENDTRGRKIMLLASRARLEHRADKLTALHDQCNPKLI